MTNDTQTQNSKPQPSITAEQLKAVNKTGKVALLDVRRKADYEAAPEKIPGAVWRDPEQVDQWLPELSADQTAIIYCVRGGSVSQSVCRQLADAGIAAAYLDGGIKAWIDRGEGVE